ncbi:MerR family transcriptional regulator [Lentzea sp. NBRC 102530]|uniref:MerR family transcriptional regulator n=1 Tax=Lentzea sp. NBRC 102530 TaxID=3032201 RepID=UPI00249FA59C|nr:MerR family transcriptional regulator [Lentzea sp. NBRC 102530]GLY50399.1 transcriptional regulator [Lentzea sp. NBRC 102530]
MYTPRAVAQMLGIAPTTLRTWDQRYGLGPTARTEGGHRRYADADVEVLRKMVLLTAQGVSAAAAAVLAHQDPVARPGGSRTSISAEQALAARRGFLAAARRLDEPMMTDLAEKLIADHGVIPVWENVFVPVFVELGDLVAETGRGVEVEHLASASVLFALRATPRAAGPGVLAALLACAPDEQHWLPLEALGAALSEKGRVWRSLGARVPAEALFEAVLRLHPAVALVWAHRRELALQVPLADLVERTHTVIAVAGPGWEGVPLPSFVRRPATLTEALEVVLNHTHP